MHAQVAPGGEGVVRWWGITSDVSTPGQVTWGDAPPVRPGGDGLGWVISRRYVPYLPSTYSTTPPVTNTTSYRERLFRQLRQVVCLEIRSIFNYIL